MHTMQFSKFLPIQMFDFKTIFCLFFFIVFFKFFYWWMIKCANDQLPIRVPRDYLALWYSIIYKYWNKYECEYR